MGKDSGIQWCEHTWNPWVGCSKVSPGCENCYMFKGMARFGRDPSMVQRTAPATFRQPLTWDRAAAKLPEDAERARVFTCSWSDWFHRDADPWRDEAWEIVRAAGRLDFLILSKRHGRILEHLPADWGTGYPNVWLGVSGEDHGYTMRRVTALARVPAAVRFLSAEPCLREIRWPEVFDVRDDAGRRALDWVILGGESGPEARPFEIVWAYELIEAARLAGVKVFIKQLGSHPVDHRTRWDRSMPVTDRLFAAGRLYDPKGGDISEWPSEIQVREWPEPRR